MGKQWKQCQTLFFWAPKSLEMVTAAMKIKDTCYLEEKLYFNLVLPLYVLVSNVHSYQNYCVFFCGSFQCPFIYSIDKMSA